MNHVPQLEPSARAGEVTASARQHTIDARPTRSERLHLVMFALLDFRQQRNWKARDNRMVLRGGGALSRPPSDAELVEMLRDLPAVVAFAQGLRPSVTRPIAGVS